MKRRPLQNWQVQFTIYITQSLQDTWFSSILQSLTGTSYKAFPAEKWKNEVYGKVSESSPNHGSCLTYAANCHFAFIHSFLYPVLLVVSMLRLLKSSKRDQEVSLAPQHSAQQLCCDWEQSAHVDQQPKWAECTWERRRMMGSHPNWKDMMRHCQSRKQTKHMWPAKSHWQSWEGVFRVTNQGSSFHNLFLWVFGCIEFKGPVKAISFVDYEETWGGLTGPLRQRFRSMRILLHFLKQEQNFHQDHFCFL